MTSLNPTVVDEATQFEIDQQEWIDFAAQEEEFQQEQNPKKRPRNAETEKTSEVWNHFKLIEGSNPPRAQCGHCLKSLACHPVPNGTSTMSAHMYFRCLNHPLRVHLKDKKQTTLSFKPNGGGGQDLVSAAFSQEACREALAQALILDELSFKFVEGEGFLNFCRVATPMFKVPCRTTIARDCLALFLKEKKKLMKALKGQRICLTTDTWTSVQNINYMVITAHYVDNEWNLNKKILSFSVVPNHKGKTIGKMIEKCMLEWGINSVLTITCDNAKPNDTAIDCFVRKTKDMKEVVLKHEFIQVRCSAHVLNLIVRSGLNQFEESINRVRDAVRYVRSSPSRWAKWKNYVREEKIDSKKYVCLDVTTRWNSTYKMLDTAVIFEKAFDRMEEDDDGYREYFSQNDMANENEDEDVVVSSTPSSKKRVKVPPDSKDWDMAKLFVKFLEVYYTATNKISGSKYVTSDLLFNELIRVYRNLSKLCDSLDTGLQGVGRKMLAKFEKYWRLDKVNPLLLVAVILDPRFKLGYLKFTLERLHGKDKDGKEHTKTKSVLEMLNITLKNLYGWYAMQNTASSVTLQTQNLVQPCTDGEMDIASEWKRHNKSGNSGCISEIDKYLTSPIEEENDGSTFEILCWWKRNAKKYPILCLIARDLLAIPVTSVASESAFSTGGRILDCFRSSLRPNTVEALICTQNWLRSTPKEIDLQASLKEIEEYDEIDEEIFEAGLSSQNWLE